MCARLPVVDPARITAPTLIMRGQFDGIAGFGDLLDFFTRLPNPDKHFAVMPGFAHASFQERNYRIASHILHAFFGQPAPVYRGEPGRPPWRTSLPEQHRSPTLKPHEATRDPFRLP